MFKLNDYSEVVVGMKWVSVFVLCGVLLGCSDSIKPTAQISGVKVGSAVSDQDTAVAPGPLRLFIFDCGRIRFESVAGFGLSEGDTATRELVAPCYIIDHPKGQLLWDAGLPSDVAKSSGWVSRGEGVDVALDKTLAKQLKEMALGFDLDALEFIAFSHIHWDHVGAANDVSNGQWLVQEGDYRAFLDPTGAAVPAVDPTLLVAMEARPVRVLTGDHDVFGDGRVKLVAAYGHTPGHQVLYVDLANFGPVVLSGDLYHFPVSRANRVVPLFNVDKAATLAAMDRVEAVVSETEADFWIQHDLEHFLSQKKAPEFYQ